MKNQQEEPGATGTDEATPIDGPYESAFDALFEPDEAANLKVRSQLMNRLTQHVEERGLSQPEAADALGTSQPRVSNLLKGSISKFTIDALLNMCTAAGIEVEVSFPGAHAKA